MNKLDEHRKKLCGIHLTNQKPSSLNETENLKATLDLNKMYENLELLDRTTTTKEIMVV